MFPDGRWDDDFIVEAKVHFLCPFFSCLRESSEAAALNCDATGGAMTLVWTKPCLGVKPA